MAIFPNPSLPCDLQLRDCHDGLGSEVVIVCLPAGAEPGKLQRANLDGSNVEDLVITGLLHPLSLALDVAAGKIYWLDHKTQWIQRANLDGSNIEELVTTGLDGPSGLALDLAAGKMYWTDSGTDRIQRANLVTTRPAEPLVCGGTVAVERSTTAEVPSGEIPESIGRRIGNDPGNDLPCPSVLHSDNGGFPFRPPFM